jgi:hypothetical protein
MIHKVALLLPFIVATIEIGILGGIFNFSINIQEMQNFLVAYSE